MSPIYHDEIKNAIMEQISSKKQLHKRDVKQVIDQVKNEYLWNSRIDVEDLNKIIGYFKNNWQELKDKAKSIRKTGEFMQFRKYQI